MASATFKFVPPISSDDLCLFFCLFLLLWCDLSFFKLFYSRVWFTENFASVYRLQREEENTRRPAGPGWPFDPSWPAQTIITQLPRNVGILGILGTPHRENYVTPNWFIDSKPSKIFLLCKIQSFYINKFGLRGFHIIARFVARWPKLELCSCNNGGVRFLLNHKKKPPC